MQKPLVQGRGKELSRFPSLDLMMMMIRTYIRDVSSECTLAAHRTQNAGPRWKWEGGGA